MAVFQEFNDTTKTLGTCVCFLPSLIILKTWCPSTLTQLSLKSLLPAGPNFLVKAPGLAKLGT